MRRSGCVLLVVALCCLADDLRLTPEDRQAENEWLASLGLKVPPGGPLLEQPFAGPLTRRSFLVPTAWWRTPQPASLRAADFRQDLALLHTIMEKAYGGWESAEKRGWDWNRWFSDWDRELAAKGEATMTLAEALAPFQRLEQFQLDNHSGPADGVAFLGSGSRTAVLDSAPSGDCSTLRISSGETFPLDANDPAQRPHSAKILRDGAERPEDGFYMSYPARRGQAIAVQCGGKWIAIRTWELAPRNESIAALAQQPPNQPSYRTVSETIGYLRMPSLSKTNGELFRKLLPSLPESAGREKLLILDLRQNEGGDNLLKYMGRWIDVKALQPAMRFTRRQPKSCVYDALRWGYTQNSSKSLKPPLSNALRGSLQTGLDELFRPAEEGCPVRMEEDRSEWDYRRHNASAPPPAEKPRLMMLVDNGCGSDCEFTASVLAAVPGSVLVGESTFGVAQFIQPGYFILPRKRLKFRIATGVSDIYGDGRSFDGYGLGPDIVLEGEEAHRPETVLKLANALAAR
jgi:hypothetical protein